MQPAGKDRHSKRFTQKVQLLSAPLRNGRQIGSVVILAGVYFAAAKLGLKLAFVHPSATAVWPPTGIALASLLVMGYRAWPGVFLGAFLANLTTEGTVWTSLGIATGNTLEGLVGTYLVNTYASGRNTFDRAQDIFKFAALAAIVSTTVSATVGVTSLALGGFARWADYRPIWLTWWMGDAAGALITAPLLVLWSKHPKPGWGDGKVLERTLFLSALLLVSWIVFGGIFPFAYLTVPFLVWAAFRFNPRDTATVVALLALLAVWGTVRGLGPFAGATPNESLLLVQAFMGIMVMVALPLASVVADATRIAIENARLYQHEHHVAKTLQQAFLPAALPDVPGVKIDAAYIPGASESEIGGDWYDVFRLPDGRIACSVGDVVGSGLQAAVIMGQVRQSIRVTALEGDDPSVVLHRASQVLRLTYQAEGMATAAFGLLDPVALTFTYATAAHPAPMLAVPDQGIQPLPSGGSPLGLDDGTLAPIRSVSLPPGALLTLYTDGLIESTRNLAEGEKRLLAAMQVELDACSSNPASSLLERVVRADGASDDVAIVTISIARDRVNALALTLPAEPESLRQVRQALRQLAKGLRLDEDTAFVVQVLLGEAVNNTIEHAYGSERGMFHVRVWRDADMLKMEVSDQGHWRPERPEGRGHGINIMHSLADSVEIDRRPVGTTARLALRLTHTPAAPPPATSPSCDVERGSRKISRGEIQMDDYPRFQEGQFSLRRIEDIPVVDVSGDVDMSNARILEETLEHAARLDRRVVVVSLAGASFLDSKAIHSLFRFGRRLATNRQRLLLVIPTDRPARRIVEITGLAETFPVFESVGDAITWRLPLNTAQDGGAGGG